jgi:hypothetical protein
LRTIHHETFEIGMNNTKRKKQLVEFCPHDIMLHGFGLRVKNCNGEHFKIHWVLNMTHHGGPFLNTLHVIKHQPCILKIITMLHLLDQINPACQPMN